MQTCKNLGLFEKGLMKYVSDVKSGLHSKGLSNLQETFFKQVDLLPHDKIIQ